jgi:drug/metabolite transporter (DMT)-like permease
VLIHIVYFAALIESYTAGDMGLVYPLARGSAPLMTAIGAAVWLNEHIGLLGWLGIAVLAAGVLLLSLRGSRDLAKLDQRAIRFALLTAVTICAYTLVDGVGARAAGNAHAYTAAIFVGIGFAMAVYALVRRGREVFPLMTQHWRLGAGGGVMQVTSYGIAIWAMTVAPIALVGALRETSVLFGTILAVVFLKEPLLMPRVAAALLIVCGLVMIRLS